MAEPPGAVKVKRPRGNDKRFLRVWFFASLTVQQRTTHVFGSSLSYHRIDNKDPPPLEVVPS